MSRTVPFHLNYPPYPWLEEAKLGMEIGRYFDSVELIAWVDPTESEAGTHTFRFHPSEPEAIDDMPVLEVNINDLPYCVGQYYFKGDQLCIFQGYPCALRG